MQNALLLHAGLAAALVVAFVGMLVNANGPFRGRCAHLARGDVGGMSRRIEIEILREGRELLVLLLVRLAHDRAPFHRAVLLRAGDLMRLPGLGQLRADGVAQALRVAQFVGVVEAHIMSDAARATGLGALASVAQREAEGIIREAGLHPDRPDDFASAEFDLDDVLILDAEFFRRLAADEHETIPDRLGDGVGEFLEPGVIRPASVIHLEVAMEDDFQAFLRRGSGRNGIESLRRRTGRNRRVIRTRHRARQEAIVQKLLPRLLETTRAGKGAERLAYDVVRLERRLEAADAREHFQLRDAIEQRRDERLHRHQRAVSRARVAPGFEVMRLREAKRRQVTCRERLVLVSAEADDVLRLGLRLGPLEVGGRGERGIAAEDHQRVHLAGGQQRRHFRERVGTAALWHVREENSFTVVAERRVEQVGDDVNRHRLTMARHDHGRARVVPQILRADLDPLRIHARGERQFRRQRGDLRVRGRDGFAEMRRDRHDLAGRDAQPMIRRDTRQRHQAFNRIEAVHCVTGIFRLPPFGEATDHLAALRLRADEIRVQREDRLRLFEPINGHVACRRAADLKINRLVGDPLRLWILRRHQRHQPRARGRAARLK